MNENTTYDHTSTGIREIDMPGARHLIVVTKKFTAPTVVEIPTKTTPTAQKSMPLPGENNESESGAYANHPPSGAVPNANPAYIISPPNTKIQ